MTVSEAIAWLDENQDDCLYVRVHGVFAGFDNIPLFAPHNAKSTLNGCGPDDPCPACDGDGELGEDEECEACSGTGLADNENTTKIGYSCYMHPADLRARFGITSTDEDVVIFSGENVGSGFDGEPLVVPDGRIEVWTSLEKLQAYNW